MSKDVDSPNVAMATASGWGPESFFQVEEGISPGYGNTSCSRELIFMVRLPASPPMWNRENFMRCTYEAESPSHAFPDGREESQV